ncbi:hypothetical protein FACS189411_10110 [Bacteroidia bacterium]|nr:hypothetical protein FACS189411_10110 [Bacteroidia bacterium]
MLKTLLTLILAAMCVITAKAQVGINTEKPNPFTVLDVVSNDKGMLIPRLNETERDALIIDESANSLLIFNTTENCYNYWSYDEREWKSLCGNIGKAVFDPIDCSAITVYGDYVQGSNVDPSHYLSLEIDVLKAGTFTINGTTGNGYYFTLTSSILTTGLTTLSIPAQGKPGKSGTDHLVLNGVPLKGSTCSPTITVDIPTATYAIDCNRITVMGAYQAETSLTADNKLSMYVTVTEATPAAGSYYIKSDTKDGLSFSVTGNFTAPGTYLLEIPARGTVNSSKVKNFTLTTNSKDGAAVCHFDVTPVVPSKKVYVYGDGYYRISNAEQRKMLESKTNFGPAGTVKYEGFTYTNGSTSDNLVNRGNDPLILRDDLASTTPPDIIHVTYPIGIGTLAVAAIVDYAKKGGVVILTLEDADRNKDFVDGLFGINATVTRPGRLDGKLFTLPILNNDPIINGPFGNLSGKTFAYDGGFNNVITNVPLNQVTVYSTDDYVGNTSGPTEGLVGAFRHNSLNVVFFPDGGTLSGDGNSGSSTNTAYPVKAGSSPDFLPVVKTWQGGVAYNSYLLCNIMAWALNQAQYYGINSANYK